MIVVSSILIIIGLIMMVVGSLGMVSFPDIYSRLQASGVSDNTGIAIILVGLIIKEGLSWGSVGLLLILIFLLLTNPIATHSIAKSAFVMRKRPYRKGEEGGSTEHGA